MLSLSQLFRDKHSPRRKSRLGAKRPKPASPSRRLRLEGLESRRLLAGLPYGATEGDLGEFLLGSVAVTPVFLESTGAIDPDTEDWTSEHIQEVLDNINEGLDWWVDTLATKSSIHQLSFSVDTTFAESPVETDYEPISRRSNDYTLWVQEFLAGQGFSTSNIEQNIRNFNQSQREKLGTDWSFTMFVVPSQNDADGMFSAGGSFSRAFAFAGGLFLISPSTRPASTFTHESGHIFWARDEYLGGGTYFSKRGYYDTQNENAADNPTPGFVQQPSIMASGTLLETAYENHISPDSTLAMVGWQDTDGDGIFDLLDVPHRLTGAGFYDQEASLYRFNGEAAVQTLPNMNSSGNQNDITLNRIREIEYRFDDGPWQVFAMPDEYVATVDLAVAVPSEASEISIRARDSQTTVESNVFVGRLDRADATPVAGINGAVWVDQNKNGLRDVGEFGLEQWTVELFDENGDELAIGGTVEPDDFADGVLSSGFDPALTVAAVGSDTDGRIAVFADSAATTGNKIFRVFSRSSQSFQPNFNSVGRRLQVSFSTPTSQVSVDVIGGSTDARGKIEAYSVAGELLDRVVSQPLALGASERLTLSIDSAEISYVIIGGHSNSNVKLDAFAYGPSTSTVTDSLGLYAFPGLPSGTYEVQVTPAAGYRAAEPAPAVATAQVTSGQSTLDVDFAFEAIGSEWYNSSNPYDVNDDTVVSAIDVLLIINEINANGSRDLAGSGLSTPPYIDVTGDGQVSPLDVLRVINFINGEAT